MVDETVTPRGNARAALVADVEPMRALERALEQTGGVAAPPTDLVLLFASFAYGEALPGLVRTAFRETGASVLIGCTSQGLIGTAEEVESLPALSLLRLSLPGCALESVRYTQADLDAGRPFATADQPANGWLVFADPFHLDVQATLEQLERSAAGATVVGGLASGDHHEHATAVFLNGNVYPDGAVAVGFRGAVRLRAVVSQGCIPIGASWTVTAAHHNVLESIGNRPAYQVLVETVRALPSEVQQRVRGNLFVGLAIDEYRDDFASGDFLIRNLIGADPEKGLLAVGAQVQVGQTIQFQLRDRAAADEELVRLLAAAAAAQGAEQPLAALLCACNGRGVGLFGVPGHDARALAARFGPLPVAGFFCNGEIGPVGGKLFLHGFTASIALLSA